MSESPAAPLLVVIKLSVVLNVSVNTHSLYITHNAIFALLRQADMDGGDGLCNSHSFGSDINLGTQYGPQELYLQVQNVVVGIFPV